VAGGVVWDNIGKVVFAYAGNCGGGSNNEAKALVLLWGMRIARARRINRLAIEGNLMLIINEL
jgi:hypothetical protein